MEEILQFVGNEHLEAFADKLFALPFEFDEHSIGYVRDPALCEVNVVRTRELAVSELNLLLPQHPRLIIEVQQLHSAVIKRNLSFSILVDH